jgi:hypothetical protein
MKHNLSHRARLLLTGVVWMLSLSPCGAQIFNFHVTTDTTGLIGHPAGPFYLDFELTDGSGALDSNNTAVLSHFQFGGGAPDGSPDLTGGAGGDLSSTVTLTDSSFFNALVQPFTPGTTLDFDAALSTNLDTGPTPDEFAFKILDCMGTEIPTTGLGNSLLLVKINSHWPDLQTFASDPLQGPACGGDPFDPQIVTTAAAVPEPGAMAMFMSAGVCGSALLLLRRKK